MHEIRLLMYGHVAGLWEGPFQWIRDIPFQPSTPHAHFAGGRASYASNYRFSPVIWQK